MKLEISGLNAVDIMVSIMKINNNLPISAKDNLNLSLMSGMLWRMIEHEEELIKMYETKTEPLRRLIEREKRLLNK